MTEDQYARGWAAGVRAALNVAKEQGSDAVAVVLISWLREAEAQRVNAIRADKGQGVLR